MAGEAIVIVFAVVVGIVGLVVVLVLIAQRQRKLYERKQEKWQKQQRQQQQQQQRQQQEIVELAQRLAASSAERQTPAGLTLQNMRAEDNSKDSSERIISTNHKVNSKDSSERTISTHHKGLRTFTFQELSVATDNFNMRNCLGRGGFGYVYKGNIEGNDVAIKKLQLQPGRCQGEREFEAEINVMGRVHHKNLLSLVGYCVSEPEMLLVYECVDNNTLAFHLRNNAAPLLDWATRLSIAVGAAKGIAYLHEECEPRIIHRDIKSTNILLDSSFRPKVADFGLAKFAADDETHVTTRIMGTDGYLDPEFRSSGQVTEKSDVYSFGVVLLELITGQPPFNLADLASPYLNQALEDGDFDTQLIDPKLGTNYDHGQMSAMVNCAAMSVQLSLDHRPKMSQIVQVLEGNILPEALKAKLVGQGLIIGQTSAQLHVKVQR